MPNIKSAKKRVKVTKIKTARNKAYKSALRTFVKNALVSKEENAVKIARSYTGRPNIIVFTGAFHGRTSLTMTIRLKNW